MACFTIPLAEALLVSAAKAVAFRRNSDGIITESRKIMIAEAKERLGWLENMLYGGSFLLAAEHLYHKEISLLPPFLTAVKTPEEIPAMLHEMATVGVGMALLTTAVWAIIVCASRRFSRGRSLLPGGGLA